MELQTHHRQVKCDNEGPKLNHFFIFSMKHIYSCNTNPGHFTLCRVLILIATELWCLEGVTAHHVCLTKCHSLSNFDAEPLKDTFSNKQSWHISLTLQPIAALTSICLNVHKPQSPSGKETHWRRGRGKRWENWVTTLRGLVFEIKAEGWRFPCRIDTDDYWLQQKAWIEQMQLFRLQQDVISRRFDWK